MRNLWTNGQQPVGLWMLVGAMAALYVAARTMFDVVARLPDASSRKLAVAQWMPIALVAIVATLMGRPQIAIGVIFATSVAALSLVLGLTAFLSPIDLSEAPGRRAWPFVLPTAMLVLMAGFSGELTLWHAAALVAEALVVLPLWDEVRALPFVSTSSGQRRRASSDLAIILAVCLAMLGAWAASAGAERASREIRTFSSGLIATVVLSPALVLPMIGSGTIMAQRGKTATLIGSHIAIVLLNLLVLLPVTIVCWYAGPIGVHISNVEIRSTSEPTTSTTKVTTTPSTSETDAEARAPLLFPMAAWRVDTVVLIVLGVMLLPLSTGRWQLGRAEGIVLIVAYMTYLIAATRMGARWW